MSIFLIEKCIEIIYKCLNFKFWVSYSSYDYANDIDDLNITIYPAEFG